MTPCRTPARARALVMVVVLGLAAAGAPVAAQQAGRVDGGVQWERGAVAGAVVFLVPETPRSYAPPGAPAVIDQVDLRFTPQVVAVLPGTMVAFPNSDPILHNVFSPRGPGGGFDLGTYPPGETRSRRFTEPGMHVILCHVHPEMLAYVAVVPAPYHTVSDAAGAFAIDGVPPGRYVLRVWHGRRHSADREVVVAAGRTASVQLRLER
jgi:plastocyanin